MALELETLLDPIPGDDPGGAEVRYEPIFRKLKEARTEEEDLPAGDWSRDRKEADWSEAIRLASTILREHAKDLQTAVWLAEALLRKDGPPGLAQGLEALACLVDGHWDHLHPRLEDPDDIEFRAAPLDWLGSYLVPAVRLLPVDAEGHTLTDRRAAREVGYEADLTGMESREARNAKLAEGKPAPETLDAAFEQTTKAWFRAEVEGVQEALAALRELERVADERFGADAPRLSPLRDALDEVRRDLAASLEKKLEKDPDPVEPEQLPPLETELPGTDTAGEFASNTKGANDGNAPVAGVVAGSGTGVPALAGAATTPPGSREEAEAQVAAAARFLRRQDPTDPASYLLLRGFRWGELRRDPERVDPRLLAPPPTELRTRLRTHLLDGAWAPLLEGAEEVMATPYGRGWIDLQRYVLEACEGLGSAYDAVARAVRGALGELLRDLPSLVELTLLDDTPTANAETRGWLASSGILSASEHGGEGAPALLPSRGGRDPWALAQQRVEAGKPEEAVQLLVTRAEQERSARDRFLRRTQAASIMVDMGRAPIARPILEELAREIETHTLESYEAGETVAEPLSLLYRALLQMGESGHQVEELYLRICRLDPMGAIRLPRPDDA